MATKLTVNDFYIYRWRYIIGYAAIAILLIGLFVFAGLFVPGGLTNQEIASTITSDHINFKDVNSLFVINLPYHLLQTASINLLGVTVLSVKLPSLILGMLSAVGLVFLLRRWFKYNVAILAAIIAFSTGQFLFIAQDGTSAIMYLFWSIWLLLAATMAASRGKTARLWRYIFFFLVALSLYTPLSVYVILTIVSAVLLHPHLRYLFKKIPTVDVLAAATVGSMFALPLIYKIITVPSFGLTLLGIPTVLPSLKENVIRIFDQYLGFANPGDEFGVMLPLFGLGSLMLIIIGAIAMFRTHQTVKAYIVIIWTLLLTPVLILNPNIAAITFVPAVLLMANGVNYLFSKWYSLFPRNPYARVTGLIPLVVLVSILVVSGIGRYAYGYYYSPSLAGSFSKDIDYVQAALSKTKGPVILAVPNEQIAFYQVAASKLDFPVVITSDPSQSTASTVIISGAIHEQPPTNMTLNTIITNGRSKNADRFYIYKNSNN